jgi:DNA-binding transcriptional LysR family regulator
MKRIGVLESLLGLKLVTRVGRGVRLTPEARMLTQSAKRITDQYDQFVRNFASSEEYSGTVVVGAAEVILRTWFPEFLRRTYDAYPQLNVEIQSSPSIQLETQLLDHEIDIALKLSNPDEIRLRETYLGSFRMHLASFDEPDARHTFAHRRLLTVGKGLKPYIDLVACIEGVEELENLSIVPVESLGAIISLMDAGIGIGAVPVVFSRDNSEHRYNELIDLPDLITCASILKSTENSLFQGICDIAKSAAEDYSSESIGLYFD